MRTIITTIGLMLISFPIMADQTTCVIKNFVCVDQIFYNKQQPATIKTNQDCIYGYDKVVFDLTRRTVKHSETDKPESNEKIYRINKIKDGASATLIVEYSNEINSTIAAIRFSRDGKVIISYSAQNMSYDGYPSTALGACKSPLSYSMFK